MTDHQELHRQLNAFFAIKLNMSVPSINTDLVGTGLLDSLALIELLLYLEREFGIAASIDELEIDHFRCIVSIADYVLHQSARRELCQA